MIEQSLFTALSGLAGGRVYPLTAPDSPTKPFIIYQNIANTPEVTLANGVPINNTRMQIDCYDKTYAAVKALAVSVQAAMAAASFTNVPLMNQDLYEQDVKLYRVQLDYSLWF
jgi:hypothetical protein